MHEYPYKIDHPIRFTELKTENMLYHTQLNLILHQGQLISLLPPFQLTESRSHHSLLSHCVEIKNKSHAELVNRKIIPFLNNSCEC